MSLFLCILCLLHWKARIESRGNTREAMLDARACLPVKIDWGNDIDVFQLKHRFESLNKLEHKVARRRIYSARTRARGDVLFFRQKHAIR